MLLLLISAYYCVKVSSDCNTLGMEVIAGGQYRNKTYVAKETADDETQQRCEWTVTEGTIFPNIFNWAASTHKTSFVPQDSLGFINVSNNTDIIRYGNIILCNLSLCDNMTRIGPSNTDLFMQYRPVLIATDLNLSHIIHAPSIDNESEIYSHHKDEINIIFYFYAVHYNDTHILDIIADIFEGAVVKDTDYIASVRWNETLTTSGIIVADYRDISAVYEHLGDPHLWNQSYYQWNKVPEKYPNAIFYVYGISVLCSNENACNELMDPTPDEFLQVWKSVAILFVVLFILAVAIIACLLCKLGVCKDTSLDSGYTMTGTEDHV